MNYETSAQEQLALKYALYTNKNIFLTGKAGSGKTTLMKKIIHLTQKNTIIVAPTGVAAINAGGVTIHSFFRIAPCMFISNGSPSESDQIRIENAQTLLSKIRFDKRHINLIKSLDMLIIDEISMVRADLLDAVDHVLRKVRRNNSPFGGLQLLMVGDLFQLSPILRSAEEVFFYKQYSSAYFYDSLALKRSDFITIELTKIYRQTDNVFLNLLNEVRNGIISENSRQILQSRYHAWLNEQDNQKLLILSSHRKMVQDINEKRLDELKGFVYEFEATIKGDFNPENAPADLIIKIKVGARIMFLKNDRDKRFYNGKMGTVEAVDEDDDIIFIRCDEDKERIALTKDIWENISYKLNEETNELNENVKGTFEQFPIRLAWAITIHKSQGLTFDKLVIDAEQSFASGQVYVALSRCRSLEGLYLKTPIKTGHQMTDARLTKFFEKIDTNLAKNNLQKDQVKYWLDILQNSFNFQTLSSELKLTSRDFESQRKLKNEEAIAQLFEAEKALNDLNIVLENYKPSLQNLMNYALNGHPVEKGIDKCINGAHYFAENLVRNVLDKVEKFLIDNKKEIAKDKVKDLSELMLEMWRQVDKLLFAAYLCRSFQLETPENAFAEMQLLKEKLKAPHRENSIALKKEKKKKAPKGETYRITLDMFRKLKDVGAVAKERSLANSTIEGHLAAAVSDGSLNILEILTKKRLDEIKNVFSIYGSDSLATIKEKMGNEFSYGELKLVKASMELEKNIM
jgi:nucleoside-triphosphatase THEP1